MALATAFLLACSLVQSPTESSAPRDAEEPAPETVPLTWRALSTGSTASLRGLSAVDRSVVWASGSGGTVLRTSDGARFRARPVPGAEELDFRDVEAFDEHRAVILSAGQPARVYRTEDGGASWDLAFEHPDGRTFFDALAFWDESRGLAFSDPVDGTLVVIRTEDGGRTWTQVEADRLPDSPDGEAGFAASGSCLTVSGRGHAWIGLGGRAGARVFSSQDGGASWSAARTPLVSGSAGAGIFSLDFLSTRVGVAVGGDYTRPDATHRNAAVTTDGGASWQVVQARPPSGYRSAVLWTRGIDAVDLVTVGPNGSDLSRDGGRSWTRFSEEGFHALSEARDGSVWASGADGRIARLVAE